MCITGAESSGSLSLPISEVCSSNKCPLANAGGECFYGGTLMLPQQALADIAHGSCFFELELHCAPAMTANDPAGPSLP